MNTEILNIELLTEITGDPFTDTGGRVINFLFGLPQFKKASILDLVTYMADIYVNDWGGNVYAFFLNSPITQAAYTSYEWEGQTYTNSTIKVLQLTEEQKKLAKREDRKSMEAVNYYKSLIEERAPFKMGNCWITGRTTKLFKAGRHNQILGGSSTYVNFHPNLQDGLYVSKEVLIRQFFVPFGVQTVGGLATLITSNNDLVNDYFVFQNCRSNLDNLYNGDSTGPLKSSFTHPSSALFSFIDHYITELAFSRNKSDIEPEQTFLRIYRFNNGKIPDISIYNFNSQVFAFYLECMQNPDFEKAWTTFIQKHYDRKETKKLTFNVTDQRWEKEGEPIPFEEFASWKNLILNNLLYNIPIREYIYQYSENGNILPWELIKCYQMSVRKMHPKSIDLLNQVADFIGDSSEDFIEKDIALLRNCASSRDLRDFFSKLQERAFTESKPQGIISLDDYVNFLMPYDRPWSEIRDLLLISIYQKQIKS